jgi:hypothetical protein
MSPMAAKKKPKNKAKPKRPAAKPQRKSKPAAKPAAKRVQPKAKRPAVSKAAKPPAKVAKPQPEESPQPIAVIPPPAVAPTLVRPGLQKRADLAPIGVVRVTDGFQLIEESTFYSAPGRDEYVQRWSARGYTCRFTPTNNEGR